MDPIKAPWTPEQVKALNEFQACPSVHPYTCGGCNNRDGLVATAEGWRCPDCDYKQDWAHEFSAQPGRFEPTSFLERERDMSGDSISWPEALLLLALVVVTCLAANECTKVPVVNRWGETEWHHRGEFSSASNDRYDDRRIEATPIRDERND